MKKNLARSLGISFNTTSSNKPTSCTGIVVTPCTSTIRFLTFYLKKRDYLLKFARMLATLDLCIRMTDVILRLNDAERDETLSSRKW